MSENTPLHVATENGDPRKKLKALRRLRKDITRRIDKLRTVRGRDNCLRMARSLPEDLTGNKGIPMVITNDRLDLDPWALPCLNGVIDLRTGELKPGWLEDFHTKQAPVKWLGIDCPAPHFEAYINEILDGEINANYYRRVSGYAVTGWSTEPAFFVLYGYGRNGKTMLVRIKQRVLGRLVATLPAEVLLDQGKGRNAASASPDIIALHGARLAIASETDKGAKISSSRVKIGRASCRERV